MLRFVYLAALVWAVASIGGICSFQWLPEPPDGITLRRCVGDDVTFPWDYVTEGKESVVATFWFSRNNGTIASRLGQRFTTTSDRVTYTPNATLTLSNVTFLDAGEYGIDAVILGGQQRPPTRLATLKVIVPVLLANNRLEIVNQSSTGSEMSRGHRARLHCGKFLNTHHHQPGKVVWTDPNGHRLNSSGFEGGFHYLDVPQTAQGGSYSCSLQLNPEEVKCVSNSTSLEPAIFFVETPDTRLLQHDSILERLQSQLQNVENNLHVMNGNQDLTVLGDRMETLEMRMENQTEEMLHQKKSSDEKHLEMETSGEEFQKVMAVRLQVLEGKLEKQQDQLDQLEAVIENQSTEIQLLQQNVSEQQAVIENQSTEIQLLHQNASEQQAVIENQSTQIQLLQQNVSEQQAVIENQSTQIQLLQQNVSEQQAVIENQSTEIQLLQQNASQQKGLIEQQQHNLQSQQSLIDLQKSQLQELEHKLADCKDKTHSSGLRQNRTETALGKLELDVSTLQGNVTSCRSDVTNLQGATTDLRSDVTTLEQNTTALHRDVTNLHGTTITVRGDVTTLRTDVTNLQGTATTLRSGVTFLIGTTTTLRRDVTNLQGTTTTLRSDVTSLMGTTTTLRRDVTNLQGSTTALERNTTTLRSDVTSVQGSTTTLRSDVTSLKGSTTTLRRDVTNLEGTTTTLERNVTYLQGTTNTLRSDVTALKGTTTSLRSDLTSVQGSTTTLRRDVTNLQGTITTLERNTTTLGSDVTSLQGTTNTLRRDVTNVQGTTNSLRSDLTSLQGSTNTLRRDVTNLQGTTTKQNQLMSKIVKVRLVGGSTSRQGRVEVLAGGQWGTVCDDSFDSNDASVICSMLGFSRSGAVAKTEAFFGAGSGSIILDDLACTGNEEHILLCPSTDIFSHNCGHNEDAGVICQ